MSWTTITLRTTTPVFNGDDGQIRVSSLRGAMRYWFRALVGTRVGNDLAALAAVEDQVFGSLTTPSRVQFRLPDPPDAQGRNNAVQHSLSTGAADAQWITYLLGQGLTYLEEKDESNPRKERRILFSRDFVSGAEFHLKLRLASTQRTRPRGPERREQVEARAVAIDALLLASLWLLCTYGGVGSRTRRGFGGLRIEDVGGPTGGLPGPWTSHLLRTPGLDYYRDLHSLLPGAGPVRNVLDACLSHLDALLPEGWTPSTQNTQPLYPVLSAQYTSAQLSEYTRSSWIEAAAEAGERYRRFRATEDNSELFSSSV